MRDVTRSRQVDHQLLRCGQGSRRRFTQGPEEGAHEARDEAQGQEHADRRNGRRRDGGGYLFGAIEGGVSQRFALLEVVPVDVAEPPHAALATSIMMRVAVKHMLCLRHGPYL